MCSRLQAVWTCHLLQLQRAQLGQERAAAVPGGVNDAVARDVKQEQASGGEGDVAGAAAVGSGQGSAADDAAGEAVGQPELADNMAVDGAAKSPGVSAAHQEGLGGDRRGSDAAAGASSSRQCAAAAPAAAAAAAATGK